jgi:hypothetical protein
MGFKETEEDLTPTPLYGNSFGLSSLKSIRHFLAELLVTVTK